MAAALALAALTFGFTFALAPSAASAHTGTGTRLALTVALRPRDPAGMARYAAAVSDPASPHYRHYLTPAQFAARYAPTARTIAAVAGALRRSGLRPQQVSANHLAIPVQATAGQAERAFRVRLEHVTAAHGREALVNTTAPRLSPHIARDVQAVLGLDGAAHATTNFVRGRRASRSRGTATRRIDGSPIFGPTLSIGPRTRSEILPHLATGGPQPCRAVIRAAEPTEWGPAWTADQVAEAYDFTPLYRRGDFGQGITIAVYEDEPNLHSDIRTYERCYGLHTRVSYVKVGRGNGHGPGSGEATMDIDQLVSLAPRAHIIVYDGPNSTDAAADAILNAIVSDDAADVISDSWGECETDDGHRAARVDDTLLQEAAIQGQTFVIAAGDEGAQDCYGPGEHDKRLAVDEPASDPWATGVGGTLLSTLDPHTERAWNDRLSGTLKELGTSGAGAGGGGLSRFWRMPDYQRQAPRSLGVLQPDSHREGCSERRGYCREVPDVSADADPADGYMSYWDGISKKVGGWQSVGGTSDAAPLWAALFALADGTPGCDGTDVGFVNPLLYQLAAESQPTYFHDIIRGDNDFLGGSGSLFPARPGYDMATGLGSPKAAALAPALCGAEPRVAPLPNERLRFAQPVAIQLVATPATGVTYHEFGLPAGVNLNPSTGVISGAPEHPGVFYVDVWVTTPTGAVSSETGARWTVAT